MYRGHYLKPKKRRTAGKRTLLLAVALILLLTMAIGGTVAYLVDAAAQVKNQFQPVQVSCQALPQLNSASVKNTSDVDAYLRARLVVNWMNSDGNVYAIAPQVSVTYADGWIQNGGIWYYTGSVASGAAVKLAETIEVTGDAPEGYKLSVEVVAEAIQAAGTNENGTRAVVDAWGVDPAALR